MSIVKVYTALFVVFSITISGGVYAQKLLTPTPDPHPRFHPLLSQSLKEYPGLKFHPHSEHYIYTHDTIQTEDKDAFEALVSKFKQTPDLSQIALQYTTTAAPSSQVPAITTDPNPQSPSQNSNTPATSEELYLISKYWLQLLPDIKPELIKCLAGPTENPSSSTSSSDSNITGSTSNKLQFPSNCPSSLAFSQAKAPKSSEPQTTLKASSSSTSNSQTQVTTSSSTSSPSPSFSLPSSLYVKLQKCPITTASKCQPSKDSEDCYCTVDSCAACTDTNSCKCYPESELTIGPRFFTSETIASNFSYPNPSDSQNSSPTFNVTNKSSSPRQNFLSLPHFSFPLPHSSHITPQTTNSIASSETKSLQNSTHWPQPIPITNLFSKGSNNSLETLVSNLLASPSSFNYSLSSFEQTSTSSSTTNETLTPSSPNQLFFFRYLATLYALFWSYSPDSLPIFTDYYYLQLTPNHYSNAPFFHSHPIPPNPTTTQTQLSQ